MDFIPVNYRISIQVSLSGYSFKIESSDSEASNSSGWLAPDRIFTTPEFQKRYQSVDISLFTHKFTLVPTNFFDPLSARTLLCGVVKLRDTDKVEYVDVPSIGATLVYSNSVDETLSKVVANTVLNESGEPARVLPEMYYILNSLKECSDYNKIIASYKDSYLYLAISQGKSLLLCNSFQAPDFTTAEYFIFLAMKKLQLNPEMSTICFRTDLSSEEEMSLYRYFKSVEQI